MEEGPSISQLNVSIVSSSDPPEVPYHAILLGDATFV